MIGESPGAHNLAHDGYTMSILVSQDADGVQYSRNRRLEQKVSGDAHLLGIGPRMRTFHRHVLDVAPVHVAAQCRRLCLHAKVRHDGVISQDVVRARRKAGHQGPILMDVGKGCARDLHLLDVGDRRHAAHRRAVHSPTQDTGQKPSLGRHFIGRSHVTYSSFTRRSLLRTRAGTHRCLSTCHGGDRCPALWLRHRAHNTGPLRPQPPAR